MKLLDYQGLSHFWDNVDDIKQDKLTIDTELDATSHNPVENMAIKFEIDQLLKRIDDGDDENTFLYELYKGIIPYTGSGEYVNTYTSTCYCLVHGLVATIYFDIIGNYGAQQFAIDTKIPADYTPFKGLVHLVAQSQSEFNNISIGTDGQIIITSNNGNFDTHCAITYLIKPSSVDPDYPDPLPSEEAQYTTSARLVKIGNYFPTVSGNTIGGQTMRGVALMTDVSGSEFSGYEGGYTVYLTEGQNTTPGVEQFYWNKKYENDIVIDGNIEKGKLFSFTDCFEAANGVITENDLIEKGIDMVEALAESTETIQYFVTGFGKNAWVGGVNSAYNSQIKEKAYGGTSDAGNYDGRFYWQNAILAHVFRYVPASGEQYIVDKSHPVERDNVVIGYIDKIIPLKLIDTAYNWANFNVANGSTWRAPKLISTQETLATLHDTFEAQLVFEDWNNPSTTGNKFGNLSNYYQRIDAKLVETSTESGGGGDVHIPDWLSSLPAYESMMPSLVARNSVAPLADESQPVQNSLRTNEYIELAIKTIKNNYFIARLQPFNVVTDYYDENSNVRLVYFQDLESSGWNNTVSGSMDYFTVLDYVPYNLNISQIGSFPNHAVALIKYDNNNNSWVDQGELGIWDINLTKPNSEDYDDDTAEIYIIKVQGLDYDFKATADYNNIPIYPETGSGGGEIVTSIDQEYVQVRTGKNWAKTSNRLQTYTGSEFN